MSIKPKSKWVYVGGSDGYGLVHTVISISGIKIITWSDADQGSETDEGYSWSGAKEDFLELFKPLDSTMQAV